MKICFVTTNKHKVEEVRDILKDYPIELEHLNLEYDENHDLSIEEVAKTAAKKLANKLNKPILLEDTGCFLEAYNNFPGALSKFVINSISYKGIFKLLDRESRKAFFKTVAAFCKPGEEPILFEGILNGEITKEVFHKDKDTMLYNKIFIPEEMNQTISHLSLEEWNKISQRSKAFKKFGEFIKQND